MPSTLQQLLIEAAIKFPKSVALQELGGKQLSYSDLDAHSEELAAILLKQGLTASARVAIYAHKSINFVVSIFGILKANAAYIPLPSDSPIERNVYVVENCQTDYILIEAEFEQAFKDAIPHPLIKIEQSLFDLSLYQIKRKEKSIDGPTGLSYILYTSGSTGQPKGVTFTHTNALSFVNWCSETFKPDETKVFSSHASFHFDLSILDLFLCIKHGAKLIIFDEKNSKNPQSLTAAIQEYRITNWYSTPTILKLMLQYGKMERYDCSSLETVLYAGEVFHSKYLRDLKEAWPKPVYYNLYGPTETNVCNYFKIPDTIPLDKEDPYPIGKVCEHLEGIMLMHTDHSGELCIKGPAVTSGYWQLPERNAIAFHVDENGTQWYKTGDLTALDAEGNYIYLDRIDRMVKRRGYRIELGEVEAALHRHPDVNDAAVIAYINDKKDVIIRVYLHLTEGTSLTNMQLKQYCSTALPMYMIPDEFSFLDRIPKTSTDKTDYQGLKKLV